MKITTSVQSQFTGLFTCILILSTQSYGQPQSRNIDQAQTRIQERMIREQGGSNPSVRFNNDSSFEKVSNSETRVRGSGTYFRDRNDPGRNFTFESIFNVNNGTLRTLNYSFTGSGGGPGGGGPGGNRPGGGGPGGNRPGGGGPGGIRPPGNVTFSGAIINRNSSRGLDVHDRSSREGANVQQWEFADQPNQTWDVISQGRNEVAIVAQHSGMALTVDSQANGGNVVQRRWSNNSRQRWRLQQLSEGWSQIVNVGTGRCLDVSGHSTRDGANIQQWSCSRAPNQQFRLGR
jgi:hypothetical protein